MVAAQINHVHIKNEITELTYNRHLRDFEPARAEHNQL